METIWLQRPTGDIPWGFRLQGGLDYGLPISVQRVTPGSVAAENLTPGDVILKIGNVNATNITHTDAQEVIKGACNILQLTIKKSPAPLSAPLSPVSYNTQQTGYQHQSPYGENDKYPSLPNYAVGNLYNDPSDRNVNSGYSYVQERSPYDMRPQEPPQVSGYSTLPVRGSNKENTESFRPVQQTKYPYKATAGIKLQKNPQTQRSAQEDYNQGSYNYGPMSPVSYQNEYSRSDSPYNRQTSSGSQRQDSDNYPQSHFRKPTPFKPGVYDTQNGSVTPSSRMQRQTSSSSQGSNVYEATISSGYQPGSFLQKDPDDAPPMPPPPTNYQRQGSGSYSQSPYQQDYQQQSPYQRQTSQGGYKPSPYDSRPNVPQSDYQQRQPGMYVDTSDHSASPYTRQGSQPYGSNYQDSPQYQSRQETDYYSRGRDSNQSQPSMQRQQSYGSQQPQPQQQQPYGSPYTSTPYDRQSSRDQNQPQQTAPYGRQSSREQVQQPQSTSYGRQSSRDQNPYPQPYHSPQSGGINSFDDILSPFEKFQNSNYCDKLFSRSPDNRQEGDSGIMSDLSDPSHSYQSQSLSSDTPRSTSSYSGYSPPQPDYGTSQQNLLRPAPPAPPPPSVSPPPPPPPPLPPAQWAPAKQPSQKPNEQQEGGQGQMPDKVLNTMMKHGGSQKPFAYVPTGMDLKKFKEKARARQQPRQVMPRAYMGPQVEADDEDPEPQTAVSKPKPPTPGAPPNPQTGVYKHAQYNSPLRMYSDENATQALNLQSGDNVEVSGVSGTPEKPPSDIKESEVYKMCQAADAKGKPSNGVFRDDHDPDEDFKHEPELITPAPSRGKGLSFKVLQWLTDTAEDDENDAEVESYKPRKPRDPLLRHNSEDDEMRFSGLHTKADIPSKAFQRLNQLSVSDTQETPKVTEKGEPSDEPSRIGNYDEASIRYRGKYIPSPSFRLLQTMAKDELEPNQKSESPVRRAVDEDSENDGLPDHLDDADLVEARYKGGHIPSRSFKALQMFIKDDDKEQPIKAPSEVNEEEKAGSKIKILSKGKSDSPKTIPARSLVPKENPSTDF